MSKIYYAYAHPRDAGDSNAQDMRERVVEAHGGYTPTRLIIIILENAQGIAVCMLVKKDRTEDKVYNLPARTPCVNPAHYSRAMQVYHDRHNPILVTPTYNLLTQTYVYYGTLDPVQVGEFSGGDASF